MAKYHLMKRIDASGAHYVIQDGSITDGKDVWTLPWGDDDVCDGYSYPATVRAKFEELTGKQEFDPNWDGSRVVNLVELVSDEGAHDQPSRWGNRCDTHAVYCTNDGWLYSPRKCRRTWYTGGEVKDEDCPGFAPNPQFKPDN